MPAAITDEQGRVKIDLRRLRRVAEELLSALDLSEAQLSVLLTDDKGIAQLNRRWLNRPGPTDVLSFPQQEKGDRLLFPKKEGQAPFSQSGPTGKKEPVPLVLGDVVISVQTAARRAPSEVFPEVIRYLIHGLLHLLGHTHERTRDRQRMERIGRRLEKQVRGSHLSSSRGERLR